MAEITFQNVWKRYPDGFEAVKDMNLEIKDGEFMILVGPSGCGKSTALRMVAGLEEISDGSLIIGGERVNELAPRDRDIAMVFQNYALYPHMTVRENMGFALKLAKVDKGEIDRKVDEAAGLLGLGELLGRKPRQLSGGQRQRVAMGRAIVREPKAFLMDEPLSNLDAKLRVSMRASLSQLHERLGVTTVYVTHDQVEAMTLGQRVCVMRDGKLQQADSPQALFNSPVNLFVAGFMGSPAMNFVSAQLVRDDGPAVAFAGLRLPVADALLEAKPALADYFGHDLILGIRPSDFEDSHLADADWPRIPATADVTEALGSEMHVLFRVDAPPVQHAALGDAARSGDEDDALPLVAGKSLWTARVAARSRIAPGQPVELAVDVSNLQFFDADSGLSIGHPQALAA